MAHNCSNTKRRRDDRVPFYPLSGMTECITQESTLIASVPSAAGTVTGGTANGFIWLTSSSGTTIISCILQPSLHTFALNPLPVYGAGTFQIVLDKGLMLPVIGQASQKISVSPAIEGSGNFFSGALAAGKITFLVTTPTILSSGAPIQITGLITGGRVYDTRGNLSFSRENIAASAISERSKATAKPTVGLTCRFIPAVAAIRRPWISYHLAGDGSPIAFFGQTPSTKYTYCVSHVGVCNSDPSVPSLRFSGPWGVTPSLLLRITPSGWNANAGGAGHCPVFVTWISAGMTSTGAVRFQVSESYACDMDDGIAAELIVRPPLSFLDRSEGIFVAAFITVSRLAPTPLVTFLMDVTVIMPNLQEEELSFPTIVRVDELTAGASIQVTGQTFTRASASGQTRQFMQTTQVEAVGANEQEKELADFINREGECSAVEAGV